MRGYGFESLTHIFIAQYVSFYDTGSRHFCRRTGVDSTRHRSGYDIWVGYTQLPSDTTRYEKRESEDRGKKKGYLLPFSLHYLQFSDLGFE